MTLAQPRVLLSVAFAFVLAAGATARTARAPNASSIEAVVGSQAGATPDIFMRRLAKVLADEGIVTIPIVVQNRPGGAWTVASNYVLGKTGAENILFAVVPTVYTTPITQGRDNVYDKVTPLALMMQTELVVLVRPESPWKTLADLVTAAKARERSIKIAGANVGSTDHIVTSLIEKAGGVKINFVPFDGGGGAITSAFLGGQVEAIVSGLDEAEPLIKGNKARPISLLSEQRNSLPQFRDIPTAKETGYDVVWNQYYGVAGAPNLDPAIAAWWDDKLSRLVKSKAWQDSLAELSALGLCGQQGRARGDGQDLSALQDRPLRRGSFQAEIAALGSMPKEGRDEGC